VRSNILTGGLLIGETHLVVEVLNLFVVRLRSLIPFPKFVIGMDLKKIEVF
jgi:hypothetical protein